MDLLEESIARGYLTRWWYAFDRDPVFEPLRSEARFRALAAEARSRAAAERDRLAQMRERGEVPNRAVTQTAEPGSC